MRRLTIILFVAIAVAIVATSGWARFPKSQIAGSDHDLRSVFQSASYTLCSFCHIAHKPGDNPDGPGYLLWNHTMSDVTSYGVYQSDSLHATDIADLGGQVTVSNLCLSCHDGTVAINSFYEGLARADFQGDIQEGTTFMDQEHRITDLSKQHPVNFTYDASLATTDGGLRVPVGWDRVDTNKEVPLYSSKMQCATCHDPHAGPPNHVFFRDWPQSPEGSFCLYCHQ